MDDIKSVVKQAVLEAIELHHNKPMNAQQAAEYLGISRRKLNDLAPYIPHSLIGGRKIYTPKNLDQYIEEQRVL